MNEVVRLVLADYESALQIGKMKSTEYVSGGQL